MTISITSHRGLVINKIEIFMTALFIILIRPTYIYTLTSLTTIWSYCQLIVFMYTAYVFLFKKPSLPVKVLSGIYALFLLSAIVNNVELISTIQKFSSYFCLAVLCDYWMKKYGKHTLYALHFVLLLYTFINFATIIAFPDGLYTATTSGNTVVACWFLGYKNPQIRTLLIALALEYIFYSESKKRLRFRTIVVTFVIASTLLYIQSSLALLAFVVYMLLIFLIKKQNNLLMKLLSPSGIIIMFIVMTLLIVVVDILPYISGWASVIFRDKNIATGSDRIYVWKAAIDIIKNHFVWGIGDTNFVTIISIFPVTHPHNYFLFQWMSGGIGAVLLSVVFFYITIREMFKGRQRFECRSFIAVSIVVFIMGVVESLTEFPLLYALFIIGYNLDKIYPDRAMFINIGENDYAE